MCRNRRRQDVRSSVVVLSGALLIGLAKIGDAISGTRFDDGPPLSAAGGGLVLVI